MYSRFSDADFLRAGGMITLLENLYGNSPYLTRAKARPACRAGTQLHCWLTQSATKPSASLEEIVLAASIAGADEFIKQLPQGYDTFLEEGGTNLSGGQQQRLSIARALLRRPPILIFDEATSSLDPESEAIVQENLARIAEGRTVIMVSHRLSSLVRADSIVVLDRGQIVDSGSHSALLSRCMTYRHLWNQQNRHVA